MWKYSCRGNVNFRRSVCEYSVLSRTWGLSPSYWMLIQPGQGAGVHDWTWTLYRRRPRRWYGHPCQTGFDRGARKGERYPEPSGWRLSVSLIFSPRKNLTVSKSWLMGGRGPRWILSRVTETDYSVRQCRYQRNWILRVNLLHYSYLLWFWHRISGCDFLIVSSPLCVCENWRWYVVKPNYVY